MKLLLDTHTFLWLVEGSPKLSASAQSAISDPANDLTLSAVSIWELAIKTEIKKLTLNDALDAFVNKWTASYQITLLPVKSIHIYGIIGLPFHHRDPFDRLLIAQTMVEGMTLVSADAAFSSYAVPLLW